MYYTYMLRCEDNSIYTGITTSLERRMKEHKEQGEKCAKYTKRHEFKKLEAAWKSEDRKQASKLEYEIKKLKKIEKEELIKNKRSFKKILLDKVDNKLYKRCNIEEEILNEHK